MLRGKYPLDVRQFKEIKAGPPGVCNYVDALVARPTYLLVGFMGGPLRAYIVGDNEVRWMGRRMWFTHGRVRSCGR